MTNIAGRPSNIPIIRVLINGLHAKTGGGVTYLRHVIPLMAQDPQLELHLFLHRDQYELFAGMDERIRLHLFDFNPGLINLLFWEQWALPILARNMKADVTFSPANFGPLLAPNSVVLLRNSLAVVRGEARATKRLYWIGLAIATALSTLCSTQTVAVSNYALRALTLGLPARTRRKISVIYHGVSPAYSPACDGLPREEFLLIVADVYIQKNLHTMVDAVSKLRQTYPGVCVKVAGRIVDQDYFDEISEKIKSLQLGSAFEFLGSVDSAQLMALYRRCQMLVFPSTVETFGHPLVEAMACGTPVVSSNTAAMPEVLGNAGLFFDPLNADDIAAKIEQLMNDPVERARLSRRGLERAHDFSLQRTATQTAAILKAAAGHIGSTSRFPETA